MIAAGFDNGDIKLFDLRAMKIQWSTNVLNGVCSLQFDRLGNFINRLKRLRFLRSSSIDVVFLVCTKCGTIKTNLKKALELNFLAPF